MRAQWSTLISNNFFSISQRWKRVKQTKSFSEAKNFRRQEHSINRRLSSAQKRKIRLWIHTHSKFVFNLYFIITYYFTLSLTIPSDPGSNELQRMQKLKRIYYFCSYSDKSFGDIQPFHLFLTRNKSL